MTRCIDYKGQPSLHDCKAKCLNGKVTGLHSSPAPAGTTAVGRELP